MRNVVANSLPIARPRLVVITGAHSLCAHVVAKLPANWNPPARKTVLSGYLPAHRKRHAQLCGHHGSSTRRPLQRFSNFGHARFGSRHRFHLSNVVFRPFTANDLLSFSHFIRAFLLAGRGLYHLTTIGQLTIKSSNAWQSACRSRLIRRAHLAERILWT